MHIQQSKRESEGRAFGTSSDHRVDRFEEALQIIVPLLRAGQVDFEDRYYQARDCELRPGGPPILLGAKGPRMLRLAATYADLADLEGADKMTLEVSDRAEASSPPGAGRGTNPATAGKDRWKAHESPGQDWPAMVRNARRPRAEGARGKE